MGCYQAIGHAGQAGACWSLQGKLQAVCCLWLAVQAASWRAGRGQEDFRPVRIQKGPIHDTHDACYYRGIAPVRVWGLSLTKPLDLAWQDCLDSDDGSCQHPMTLTSQSYECRQSSRT